MPVEIIVPIAGMATGVVLILPLVRLAVRVVERKWLASPADADIVAMQEELDRLREQVTGTAELGDRVTELEERVDFTERMLARSDRPGLAAGE